MTLRAKLLLTMWAIACLVAAPAIYGISRLSALKDIAAELRGRHAEAFLAVGRLQASLAALDRYQRSYIVVATPELRERVRQSLADARMELDQLNRAGYRATTGEIETRLAALEDAARQIEALVEEYRIEEATIYFDDVKPVITSAEAALEPIARTIDQRSHSAVENAERISGTATGATLVALLITLSVAIALALWVTGALVAPLHKLRAATGAVAGGSLVAPPDLPYDRSDEIGDLSRSFGSMTQRLAELDKLKAEFVSIASHELKTPINVIGGYAELLEDGIYGEITPGQREVLGAIREQTRNLGALVHQLLDLSRLESGSFPITVEEVAVTPFFKETERAFRALAVQKRIQFTVEIDSSTPATVMIDPNLVRNEVLGNLLSNAFKFTPEGGKIGIKVSAGDSLRVSVTDTGIGIPNQELPHIFDKYYQVGNHDRAKGAGLGLAIAREVIEAHGGRILAESEPGKGTTMHMEIPLQREPQIA